MRGTLLIKAKMTKFPNKPVNQQLCRLRNMILIIVIEQYLIKSAPYNLYLHSYHQPILHIKFKYFRLNKLQIKKNRLT